MSGKITEGTSYISPVCLKVVLLSTAGWMCLPAGGFGELSGGMVSGRNLANAREKHKSRERERVERGQKDGQSRGDKCINR